MAKELHLSGGKFFEPPCRGSTVLELFPLIILSLQADMETELSVSDLNPVSYSRETFSDTNE